MEMKSEYEIHDGRKYPILWRKRGSKLTDTCLFCGIKHEHGKGEGHRVSHCRDTIDNRGSFTRVMSGYFASDESYFAPKDGYFIREY